VRKEKNAKNRKDLVVSILFNIFYLVVLSSYKIFDPDNYRDCRIERLVEFRPLGIPS